MQILKKVLLGAFIFLVIIGCWYGYIAYRSAKMVKRIQTEDGLYVLGHPSCIYCNMFEPILKRTSKNYSVSYTYINTDHLQKKDLNQLVTFFHTTIEDFGTPAILIMEDGKVKAYHQGYMDDLDFFTILQTNGKINLTQSFIEPYPHITRLTGKTYLEKIQSTTPQIILVGRSGHEKTEQILQTLNELDPNLYAISFLNPSNIGTFYPEFLDSLEGYFDQDKLEMPLLLVIQENKIIKEINLSNIEKIESQLK